MEGSNKAAMDYDENVEVRDTNNLIKRNMVI